MLTINNIKKGTPPGDIAEVFHDQRKYICVSGKYFLPDSTGRYNYVSREELQRRLLSLKYGGERVLRDAITVRNVLDAFQMLYNNVDGERWPDPQLWFDAMEWSPDKYVELPFEIPHKTLVMINALITPNGSERFFIMYGKGGTGKSTTLNLIKQLFDNDVCSMTLDRLTDRFSGAEACEHRLICSDEVNSFELDSGRLKTIVSQQEDMVERKGQQPFRVRWQSKLLYCCNKPPRFDVSDSGMMRRIVYYKMDEIKSKPDPTLQKMEFTREQLLTILHKAFCVDMEDWFKVNFQQDTFDALFTKHSVYIHRDAITYSDYVDRCHNTGLKPVSEPNWTDIKTLINEWSK